MSASRPFSVIFSGWFESPSANIACPAASAWTTLAPPPGTMKPGTLTPSASKNFFSLATRCWPYTRSEEHTSELQSQSNLVCRLLLEKKKAERAPDHEPHQREDHLPQLPPHVRPCHRPPPHD